MGLNVKTIFNLVSGFLEFEDISNLDPNIDKSSSTGYLTKVISPSGIVLYENPVTSGSPDFVFSTGDTASTTIPIPTINGGEVECGTYQIYYSFVDVDLNVTSIVKEIKYNYKSPTATLSTDYDCSKPLLVSKDTTNYLVGGVLPEIVRTHTLHYPSGTSDDSIIVSTEVLNTSVFYAENKDGARHRFELLSNLTYDFVDWCVIDEIETFGLEDVFCHDALCTIYCYLKRKREEFDDLYHRNQTTANKFLFDYLLVASLAQEAELAQDCGDYSAVKDILIKVKQVSKIHIPDVKTEGMFLVTGSGVSGDTFNVTNTPTISVTETELGGIRTYQFNVASTLVNKINSLKDVEVLAGANVNVTESIVGGKKTYTVDVLGLSLSTVLDVGNKTNGRNIILDNLIGDSNKIKSKTGLAHIGFNEFGNLGVASSVLTLKSALTFVDGKFSANNHLIVDNSDSSIKLENGADGGVFRIPLYTNVSQATTPEDGSIGFESDSGKFYGYSTSWSPFATESYVSSIISGTSFSQTLNEVLDSGNDVTDNYIALSPSNDDKNISTNKIVLKGNENKGQIFFEDRIIAGTGFNYIAATVRSNVVNILADNGALLLSSNNGAVLRQKDTNTEVSISCDASGIYADAINKPLYLPLATDSSTISVARNGWIVYDSTDDAYYGNISGTKKKFATEDDVVPITFIEGTNVTITENIIGGVREVTINSTAGGGLSGGDTITSLVFDPVTKDLTINTDLGSHTETLANPTLSDVLDAGNTTGLNNIVLSAGIGGGGSNYSSTRINDEEDKARIYFNKETINLFGTPKITYDINLQAIDGAVKATSSDGVELLYTNPLDNTDTAKLTVNGLGVFIDNADKGFGTPLTANLGNITNPRNGTMVSLINGSETDLYYYKGATSGWVKIA